MSDPIRFVFGAHLHQPIGNFDYVFAQHVKEVYKPFLEATSAAGFFPILLHVSGPLLEWIELHEPAFLDQLGRYAAEGKIELLLAGFDEPILASLPRRDRVEQIISMREYLERHFGVDATGLWLTERVWEPELAADLVMAGVEYCLVDDRHFVVCGFPRGDLHRPWRTESDGHSLGLLAIDEHLRYLIPFQPPEDTAAYLRALRQQGKPLAVLADDGEKFGGWPGTREWVYEKGWLARFLAVITRMMADGEVRLVTGKEAVRDVASGGLAYLPTASYREMEEWSLPPAAQTRLMRLEKDLGPARLAADSGLVRGAHWRNFLVKYAESNRMHKMMVALSALSRTKRDPPAARRAIGRAQCNDAYWHGVFGGLYLPVLRNAIWHQLALAECELRRGERLALEIFDMDGDGNDELWVHSDHFSAVVSPRRGGSIETFVKFGEAANLADTLTRRREAYHEAAMAAALAPAASGDPLSAPSIHDIEKSVSLRELPPADLDVRAILVERMLPHDLSHEAHARAQYAPVASWAGVQMIAQPQAHQDSVEIALIGVGLEKTLTFDAAGTVRISFRWDPGAFPVDAIFATELSLMHDVPLETSPPAEIWRDPITTVAKSERGLEETRQGLSITVRWPASLGSALVHIPA